MWVFGAVERSVVDGEPSSRIKFTTVPNRSAEVLVGMILRWVEMGSEKISDKWASHQNLNAYGFRHFDVNHSEHFKDPDTGAREGGCGTI